MSSYFQNFKKTLYLFGDEKTPVAFQNLSKYVNVIDEVADEISAYMNYEIRDFERPDTLSHRLYGSSEYDWTFSLMNDHIREQGWPLPLQNVYRLGTQDLYRDWTCILDISTADSAAEFASKYAKDQEVLLNGKLMKVKYKNLQLGEITVYSPRYDPDSDLSGRTVLSYTDGSETIALKNTVNEYNGTYHYVDSANEPVDYFFDDISAKIPVTNLEKLVEENNKLKTIRVIKRELIGNIVGQFKTLTGL